MRSLTRTLARLSRHASTGGGEPARFPADQVGILVEDIETWVRRYASLYGKQEWRGWDYGPDFVPLMTYRGQKASFEMRIALSGSRPQMELIQPLGGASIYHERTKAGRYGLHHIGTFVADLENGLSTMKSLGLEPIQTGSGYGVRGDGGFAYFDTVDLLGHVIELIEVPAERRQPKYVWGTEGEPGGLGSARLNSRGARLGWTDRFSRIPQ